MCAVRREFALVRGSFGSRTCFRARVNVNVNSTDAHRRSVRSVNGAQPSAGNMFELDAIVACFIGGASTTGGIGRLSGALIGGLIMAVMSNGMQLMGTSTSTQQIVKGAVLLLAVAFDVWNKQRASA
nr:hypothetical protein [Schaalia odontolytica]